MGSRLSSRLVLLMSALVALAGCEGSIFELPKVAGLEPNGPNGPNGPDGTDEPFVPAVAGMRLLTVSQHQSAVKDLLGTAAATPIEAETSSVGAAKGGVSPRLCWHELIPQSESTSPRSPLCFGEHTVNNTDAASLVGVGKLGEITVNDMPESVEKANAAAALARQAGAEVVRT
jgi:hypothetical protein